MYSEVFKQQKIQDGIFKTVKDAINANVGKSIMVPRLVLMVRDTVKIPPEDFTNKWGAYTTQIVKKFEELGAIRQFVDGTAIVQKSVPVRFNLYLLYEAILENSGKDFVSTDGTKGSEFELVRKVLNSCEYCHKRITLFELCTEVVEYARIDSQFGARIKFVNTWRAKIRYIVRQLNLMGYVSREFPGYIEVVKHIPTDKTWEELRKERRCQK